MLTIQNDTPMKSTLHLLILLLLPGVSFAQATLWGTNNYIEYQIGTLPIVISVPHGGDLAPSSIPDRTCNDPVFVKDAFTIETALQIKAALFAATGCYPHLVISHLKRAKLDCNRNRTSGTCNHPEAAMAWDEFHGFITTAQQTANQDYDNKTFFVDLHGHGNPIQRIELGYLLYDDELALPDATLNTAQYLDVSSIKNLALDNENEYTHAQLLRGPEAFGTLLGLRGFPSVPSQQIPAPGTTTNYFSGGYITANHTCYAPGNTTNGLQMELNFAGVRDNATHRAQFAEQFAAALLNFLDTHTGVPLGGCTPVAVEDMAAPAQPWLYPNPLPIGTALHWTTNVAAGDTFVMTDVLGRVVAQGAAHPQATIQLGASLPAGVYIVTVYRPSDNRAYPTTLMLK